MTRYAVIGSRYFAPLSLVDEYLSKIIQPGDVIVSGGAKGADTAGKLFAEANDIQLQEYIPDWYPNGKYDNQAGMRRNTTIIDDSEMVLIWWDGESTGTANSLNKAVKKKLPIRIQYPDGSVEYRNDFVEPVSNVKTEPEISEIGSGQNYENRIEYVSNGDITSFDVDWVVNPVNCLGVWGKGLAKDFLECRNGVYVPVRNLHRSLCSKNEFSPGDIYYAKVEGAPNMLLFHTKGHWRNPSRINYIERGLLRFLNTYQEQEIRTIAFPKIGCGQGGLTWSVVRNLMETNLSSIYAKVYIFI